MGKNAGQMSSIPGKSASSVSDNDFENIVCKAMTKAVVEMSDKGIEDCHRVGKRDQIIVK